MTTRRATDDSTFRQERFASSVDYNRGLMGNLVARRCEAIEEPERRRLVWFLQMLSHAPGGLAKVADELLSKFPARIGTESMHKFGIKRGQVYNASQVKSVRAELFEPSEAGRHRFELRGERGITLIDPSELFEGGFDKRQARRQAELDSIPMEYAAASFMVVCQDKARDLSQHLEEMCLDPSKWRPRYFHALPEVLNSYMLAWVNANNAAQVVTELGRRVYETLDYCLQTRCMVLIDGCARTGKSHAAKAWCGSHPGEARYVQVPSNGDDMSFFRAIGKALGVGSSLSLKSAQIRERVEYVLQSASMMLVLDEAHFLWPQCNFKEKMPARISWLMTALVNYRVPVALITTPQFLRSQKTVEQNSRWTSEQFTGRIGHYEKLPDALSEPDLRAVAKAVLPDGCSKSIETLALYAKNSVKYLAAIEFAVARARFDATKAGRKAIAFADIKNAIVGSVIPSDTALVRAQTASVKPVGRSTAVLPPPTRTGTATPPPPTREMSPKLDRPHEDLAANRLLKLDKIQTHPEAA